MGSLVRTQLRPPDVAASAGRKRVRRMVIGRTNTEMKAKFRDLRRDLDSGAGPA
jgi:hypothetical protein